VLDDARTAAWLVSQEPPRSTMACWLWGSLESAGQQSGSWKMLLSELLQHGSVSCSNASKCVLGDVAGEVEDVTCRRGEHVANASGAVVGQRQRGARAFRRDLGAAQGRIKLHERADSPAAPDRISAGRCIVPPNIGQRLHS